MKTKILELTFLILYFTLAKLCAGEIATADELTIIKQTILLNYDSGIIPISNEFPLNVTVSVKINDMVPLESSEMHYSVDCHFGLNWNDYRLKFNTSKKDIKFIPFDYQFLGKIWTPDIYFTSSKSGVVHSLPQPNALVLLSPEGTVFTERRLTIGSFCPMEFLYYPFDIQHCDMYLESYSHNKEYIILKWNKNESANTYKTATEKYHIDKFNQVNIEPFEGLIKDYENLGKYSQLQLKFTLYRNLRMYILRDFLPCILITALSWITFWINYESTPARVALGITTVLTIVTMTNSVKATAPPVSKFRSIDYYLVVCNLFVFAALCEYAIVGMTPPKKEKKKKKSSSNTRTSFQKGHVELKSFNSLNGKAPPVTAGNTQPRSRNTVNIDLDNQFADNKSDEDGKDREKTKKKKIFKGLISAPRFKTIAQIHWLDRTCRIAFPLAFLFTNIVFFVFHRLSTNTVD